jgi:dihydrolipoamide dehydrogenase
MKEIETKIAVLGGGPAGYVAAIRAAQLGATVAVIEARELGGTCLNRGCIPSKALLKTSEVANVIRRSKEFGIEASVQTVDWNTAAARKNRVVKNLCMGLEHLMSLNKIQMVRGRGLVENKNRVLVSNGCEDITVNCEKLLVTTGSEPLIPDIPGIGLDGVITSDDALELIEVPESVLIIGAGAIGLEFATIFNSAGSNGTVVELAGRILPQEDSEITGELMKVMRRQGVKFKLASRVKEIREDDAGLSAVVTTGNVESSIVVQKVLVAVGRSLNSLSNDLLKLGLQVDRGRVVVDEHLETSVKDVYAAGDVIGGKLLAHLAFAEGKTAAQNALGQVSVINYDGVPACVYTNPEVASVGLSEAEAVRKGNRC